MSKPSESDEIAGPYAKGDFVMLNDVTCVVVLTGKDLSQRFDLDFFDHTAIWYGDFENGSPEVWTVPTEYLVPAAEPIFKH